MVYYPVRIEGRKRKTRFTGSRHVVYRKLHKRGLFYDVKRRYWKPVEQAPVEQNVLLLIAIGDYKHMKFDIILKRVIAAADFKNLIERSKNIEAAHIRIFEETLNMGLAFLRSRGHFGLVSMIKSNVNIDYVAGGEYTWTAEQPQEAHFIRFDIRDKDRLQEVLNMRIVPEQYSKYSKFQKKIGA
jgi:hypothetical protein